MRRAPYVEELVPVPDPWEIAQTFAGLPHLLFFDSSDRHPELGRYSFVSADPLEWFEFPRVEFGSPDPLLILQERWSANLAETLPGLPPFQGGLAGLFGYGLSHAIERISRPRFDEFQTPDLAVGLYDWVVSFDHRTKRAWLLAHSAERLNQIKQVLWDKSLTCPFIRTSQRLVPHEELAPQFPLPGHAEITSNFDKQTYLQTIRRAIEYIHAGDCFQVNIAQRLLAQATSPALEVYGRLRVRNPAPFAGFLDLGEFAVASASPERFLRVEDGQVETRPIKGTRPRFVSPEVYTAVADELAASAKDRAENVMIVDLLRNDLGRVCEYGSVRVPQVCEVETYRFVHHLVSVITGRLRPECTPFDLLRATFPGGSVTGAPKVRAMEIISELEPTARGPYCGCLGYIGFNGSMDANILIRTFTIGKGWVQFPVGGGIVADSDPLHEYEETLHKAAGMFQSL